jgi:hypothetical protein
MALSAFAQDSMDTLARILADKGTITAAEFAQVQAATAGDRVKVLAGILQQKGILTSDDVGRLGPSTLPVVAAADPNPQAQSGGQHVATPQPSPTQAAAPPVTTQSRLPLTLYGTILLNANFNDAFMNITDLPLFANKQGSDPFGNDKTYTMTARQTRLGMKYEHPDDVKGAKLSGLVEIDFFGGKAPLANGVNMDLIRLRLAYGRMDWKHFALEAGQDWAIFAPLNPTSYAEYAIPSLSASGNLWIRLPQIRAEVHGPIGHGVNLLAQFAATDPNMGDLSTTTFTENRPPGIGERGRAPGAEGRFAFSRKYDDRDFTIALSGEYTHGKNSGPVGSIIRQIPVDSWGTALDYTLPFTKKFNLTGEWYTGRELGIFSDASAEAIQPVGIFGDRGVRTSGGWTQAQFNFTAKIQMNLAYGIDAPSVRYISIGARTRNQTYMGNLMYKWSPHLTVAGEYRRILTDYRNQVQSNERGETANLAFAYIF